MSVSRRLLPRCTNDRFRELGRENYLFAIPVWGTPFIGRNHNFWEFEIPLPFEPLHQKVEVIFMKTLNLPIGVVTTVGQRGAAVRGQRHFCMRKFGYGVVFLWDFRGQIGTEFSSCLVSRPGDTVSDPASIAYHEGETKNDPAFVAALAELGDIYVNDAFSTAHRAHASTEGLAHKLPVYVGRSMQLELEMLKRMLADPKRPLAAIVGDAKVSTKFELLGISCGRRRPCGSPVIS